MSRLAQPWPLNPTTRNWLLAAAAAVVLLAVLSLLDAELSRWGTALPGPVVVAFRWISRLGDSDYALIGAAAMCAAGGVASLLVTRPHVKDAMRQFALIGAFWFCCVGLPSLITAVVKRLIGRARPALLDSVGTLDFRVMNWLDWTYQSFPSGHATTGFAICFAVSFVAPRAFPPMLVVAILISLSRIVLGAHYPTDIIAGAIVGTLGAYLVRYVFALRGWLFVIREDRTIDLMPLDALARLLGRRG